MTESAKGFNLIGYATSPMGLGEDLRSFAAMLDYLEIPFSVIDVPTDATGQVDVKWRLMTTNDYQNSIFFMSPMECHRLAQIHPTLFSQPQKRIGYFLWELPDFPKKHLGSLALVDHIWCPSRFVQETFFAKSNQLTLTLPLPVVSHAPTGRQFKKELNIPTKAFVMLFMFDLHSTMARKNPHAVLRVFLSFAQEHPESHLILKVSRWQNLGARALDWIPFHPRIKVIKETLLPGEIADLYQSSDCYLSLHRSEGFGRTLVEALQHGLHIVSTDFSGPKDFLNDGNALLVKWERTVADTKDYPHLSEPSWWAMPDEKNALALLHTAYERSQRGPNEQGKIDGAQFSHQALANKYKPILNTYLR